MNILIPTSSYPVENCPNWAPFLGDTAAALAERGNKVYVLVFAPDNRRKEYWQATTPGLFVTAYPFYTLGRQRLRDEPGILPSLKRSGLAKLQLPFYLGASAFEILRAVKRWDIDVIHAMWYLPMGFLAAFLKPLHRKPVVATALGSDLYLKGKFPRTLLRFVSRRARRNIFCSRHLMERAQTYGMDLTRSIVVPNGIRFEKFRRHRKNDPREKIKIGCSKRLLKEKRLELLFTALEKLEPEWKVRIEAVIAGGGPHKEALEGLSRAAGLAGLIRFVGEIRHDRMPDFFSEIDIFIDTSLQEGLATSNIEAMASGCVVIAPDGAGNRDLIVHGQNGFLYEQGSADGLRAILSRVLFDFFRKNAEGLEAGMRKREEFSVQAAASAGRFDVSEVAASLERVYTEALTPADPEALAASGRLDGIA